MDIVKGSSKACYLIGLLLILNCGFGAYAQETGDEERQIYVVHLGKTQHDDPELVAQSHHQMLESIFESAEDARESIIYNYHHGFSGFSAKLTKSQAKKLSGRPDVFSVAQNKKFQLQSTRIGDYMGLSASYPKGILQDSDMGSDIVIGFIDAGVWPESLAFNDKGLGPIPKHFKGKCVAGQDFDPAKHCNKKLIGAKYFLDGWAEKNPGMRHSPSDFKSPRSPMAHGTFVTSIAASSFVPNVSFKGLAPGVMRGVAPKARIAMYKVVWESIPFAATLSNYVKAIDEAIKDNVDVISISLGSAIPIRPLNYIGEETEIGSFHAVNKGIPVIAGASNFGPGAYSVDNVAPWVITVGATSLDRTFYVDMTLGNNKTIIGQAAFTGNETFGDLVYVEDYSDKKALELQVKDKVGLVFLKKDYDALESSLALSNAGAKGVIVARSSDGVSDGYLLEPVISIDYEVGYKILRYIRSSSLPTIKISPAKTLVGNPVVTKVAGFSCRGPNSISPAILKPDLVAPGQLLFGATPKDDGYMLNSGTSFSTPLVAGIVALLRAIHPDWSPAALKSALMTTAWRTDPSGEPMFAEGNPRKLADAFDYGAGMANAEKAKDPGLVYDMNLDDYIHYFCASGYNDTAITLLTGKQTKCSFPLPSVLDVNYPAITIPYLKKEATLTRTVTNVGPVDSVYKAIIEPPQGVKVVVEPETLVFNSSVKKLGFKVTVSTSHKSDTGYFFGSFTWTDGTRNVTIPLSVRPKP